MAKLVELFHYRTTGIRVDLHRQYGRRQPDGGLAIGIAHAGEVESLIVLLLAQGHVQRTLRTLAVLGVDLAADCRIRHHISRHLARFRNVLGQGLVDLVHLLHRLDEHVPVSGDLLAQHVLRVANAVADALQIGLQFGPQVRLGQRDAHGVVSLHQTHAQGTGQKPAVALHASVIPTCTHAHI